MSPRPQNPQDLDRKTRKKREANKRATFKGLLKEGFATVCNEDEAHVQINRRSRRVARRQALPPAPRPVHRVQGTLTLFIALVDGGLTVMRAKKGNGEAFIELCKVLLAKYEKIVMMVDNAAYHKSAHVKAFRRLHRDRLRVLYLPPYTPEMAVVETQVGPIKKAIAVRSPKGKTGVWRALRSAAKNGEIPVSKVSDWMIIGDDGASGRARAGSPGQRGRALGPEHEKNVITIKPWRDQQAVCPARKTRRPRAMPRKKRRALEKEIFRGSGVPRRLIARIPDGVLRDIPPGLVR